MTISIQRRNEKTLVLMRPIFVEGEDTMQLEVSDQTQSIRVPMVGRLLVGRQDATNKYQPDIDLSPFRGRDFGVSRNHAWISLSADGLIEITDLGSSNKTAINSHRLTPYIAYPVKDGDKVSLGGLEILVTYPS